MSWLKKYFLSLRTRYAQWRNRRYQRVNVPYRQACNVGVLCEVNDDADGLAARKLISLLEQDDKSVTAMALIGKDAKWPKATLPCSRFTSAHFSSWGTVRLPLIKRFAKTPFDYLYCLNRKASLPIDYLLAQSAARCRVGKYDPKQRPFLEMMISPHASPLHLAQTLHRYTSQLR